MEKQIYSPFQTADAMGRFDVVVTAVGGGINGQVGATVMVSPALLPKRLRKPVLRTDGLLTRDPRVKERKKYGRKRARKRFQFSKR